MSPETYTRLGAVMLVIVGTAGLVMSNRVKTFDPDSPAWAEEVERVVDEVVEEIEPTDPHEQSRIAEWVRGIAADKADD